MAADVAGVKVIPYYHRIMTIVETNKDLRLPGL